MEQTNARYKQSVYNTIQYNTIQLYCLCVEKFAFWLVIYTKHSTHLTIKHQQLNETRSSNTKKILNNNNVHTHTHARTHTHTLFFWLTHNLKHSINYNKTKFLKQQSTQIETLNRPQHINYRQHLWSNILNPGSI